ncbi:Ribonuclease H-like protein [Ascosphaera apis ARSEF 7405]|uniref:ribonuclease H n=1 Tax=Ascosphaera apis ARSEF 7405 TaxID=392613 RepID=A0A168BD68_9EURO|nr:Ribonuclease H-like protein [Ascosphaera apis ARSEF 7405]
MSGKTSHSFHYKESYPSSVKRVITNEIFLHSSDTPESLFPSSLSKVDTQSRFRHRDDISKCLIYTHSACAHNGRFNAHAACSFVFSPDRNRGTVSFPLERRGPSGERHRITNNRASLRAVIGALQYKEWNKDSIETIVIGSSSSYVVWGATQWVRTWTQNGWKTSEGNDVLNQDLWMCLLKEFEHWSNIGVAVEFLLVPEKSGGVMHQRAKIAACATAAEGEVPDDFEMVTESP